jgi:hypothetical protein
VAKAQFLPGDVVIEKQDENDSESVQAAWDAEIIRRMEELNSGKVKPVTLEEARRRFSSIRKRPNLTVLTRSKVC